MMMPRFADAALFFFLICTFLTFDFDEFFDTMRRVPRLPRYDLLPRADADLRAAVDA